MLDKGNTGNITQNVEFIHSNISLLERSRPVQNERDGLRVAFLHKVIDEESLTVPGDNILVAGICQAARRDVRGKECYW